MSTQITIAVIAGVAGVAGGIIAWVQAVRTARLRAEADSVIEKIKSEAAVMLEKVKAENDRRRRAFEVAAQEAKPVEVALAQAWHDIQKLKELISKILSPARYDRDLVMRDFDEAHSGLVEGYAKWGGDVPDAARTAWHRAKGSASNIALVLNSHKAADDGNLILPADVAESLREVRQSLTDQQMILGASRQTIRERLIREILEIL